ncbi:YhcH/YjgK/YiaL family protein [Pseudodesulfovibrio pelocollis]|uniref:YhcH/YjgK/YiaL family protein n=1 Tax=Pseudodesulfovibrio pelocollis TaxID=3051432 RepID=UPI00255A9B55|nr:YhcH/YjgK/YiaL family protein [Pseudodesulfovibrio sp. SB368]
MILDILAHAEQYAALNSRFQAAFDFLRRADLAALPVGRVEIDGPLHAMVAKGPGRAPMDALMETHDRHIDVHYVLDGCETIGWKARPDLGPAAENPDPRSDAAFYSDKPVAWTTLSPGMIAIHFPEDAHMPMLSGGEVHKVVVKVPVE